MKGTYRLRQRYAIILVLVLASCGPSPESGNNGEEFAGPFTECLPCREGKSRIADFPCPPVEDIYSVSKVYLPPCYDRDIQCSYPVLYLMHGAGGKPAHWLEMGLAGIMDRLVLSGEIEPYIVVMPAIPRVESGGVTYEGWDIEKEWFTDELVPAVDVFFRTRKNRLYRGIGGTSQGGAIAGLFGWKHPEVFGAVGLFGAVQPKPWIS